MVWLAISTFVEILRRNSKPIPVPTLQGKRSETLICSLRYRLVSLSNNTA
jgi:hypothetical protein